MTCKQKGALKCLENILHMSADHKCNGIVNVCIKSKYIFVNQAVVLVARREV